MVMVAAAPNAICMLDASVAASALKVSVKLSAASLSASSAMGTRMVCIIESPAKVTVSLGNTPPAKSAAVAVPAVAVQVTVADEVSAGPVRVTVMSAAPSATVASAMAMVCAAVR